MFCSKCGKTLNPAAERCSCGQAIGDSRFGGVPYTSAQGRIAPGDASALAEGAPAYTRTTYTGMDEALLTGADADARTTYRPVYEGSSVPGEIRRDVRAAVGADGDEFSAGAAESEDPLVREMFRDGEDAGIDDFDLSQLRSRPIVSEGRAGISRDVSEYVERLESSERGSRRARRAKVYGEGGDAPYEEVGEEVFADAEEGEAQGFAPRGTLRLAAKVAGALVVLVALGWGGKAVFDRVRDIQAPAAPIEGVTLALYDDGLKLVNEHADTAYVSTLLQSAQTDLMGVTGTLNADAEAVAALLPAEPGVNDQLFVEALSAIQANIGNAVTMDVLDMSGGGDAQTILAQSEERWAVVRQGIEQLTAAKTAVELTAITDGKKIDVTRPTESAAATTATPTPYEKLSKGDKSEDVYKMQQRLFELGFLLEGIDGEFGSKTQTAVKQFQSAAGLKTDGVASAETLTKLYAEDAPRTRYAQSTPTPSPSPSPTPTPEPDTDLGAEPTLLTSNRKAA